MDNVAIFKALADTSRITMLRIVMAQGPISAEQLSEHLKLVPSTISHHAQKLQQAGLVFAQKHKKQVFYSANEALLASNLNQLLQQPLATELEDRRHDVYRHQVLENFIQCGRLLHIPAQRKKRRIVLEQIVQGLEPERIYSESELNVILKAWNEDVCLLRREMISEQLMRREDGLYQRILV
jgi:ArsR family transcriptional regulator